MGFRNRAEISVVSESFEQLNRVQRDQEVYKYVKDYISDGTLRSYCQRSCRAPVMMDKLIIDGAPLAGLVRVPS